MMERKGLSFKNISKSLGPGEQFYISSNERKVLPILCDFRVKEKICVRKTNGSANALDNLL